MKKTVRMIALITALVLCALALVSCSSFASVKKNFEKNGYVLAGESQKATFLYEEYEISYTVHTFQVKPSEDDSALGNILGGVAQAFSTAIVWEFTSNEALLKALEGNAEIKALLANTDKSRYINGNCLLMTANPDAVSIFNGESLAK